ncbi:Serine/threonine-protein kinase OXI1 [Heracleum sosnowskyi]|uniref:non-specific serine/threonine protein kinase n=1 Tax=Heracleum sosnowskyi TaxID=360622 RepID=A0AAD8GRV0_9APIA|nr:Serine/threonine-protein kinase OXI1 [Heracleum sosnowskyi]
MLDEEPPAADIQTLHLDDLQVLSVLGRGGKGVVFLVQNKSASEEFFALKVISRSSIEKRKNRANSDGSEYKRVCFEQEVLRRFRHPLLPRLRGVLWTEKIVGYAMDYCPGGDLHSLRMKLTEKMFSDDVIRFYAAELVLALEYLHGLGIVYRDLKPDNVMVQENGHLMLVDFDLSTKLSAKPREPRMNSVQKTNIVQKKKSFPGFKKRSNSGVSPDNTLDSNEIAESDSAITKSKSFVGTDEYMAPEMIQGKGHDYAVDSWCLGVMLYEMLYGTTPFKGINRKETYYRILAKSPELIGEMTPVRDLIGKLLEKDPKQRISIEKIKGHEFFRGVDWNLVVEVTRPPLIPVEPCVTGMEGNNGIDVELFVQGVFKVDGEKAKEIDIMFVYWECCKKCSVRKQ